MRRGTFRQATAVMCLALIAWTAGAATAEAVPPPARHVLLLSVDGLHQTDLARIWPATQSRRMPPWWQRERATSRRLSLAPLANGEGRTLMARSTTNDA